MHEIALFKQTSNFIVQLLTSLHLSKNQILTPFPHCALYDPDSCRLCEHNVKLPKRPSAEDRLTGAVFNNPQASTSLCLHNCRERRIPTSIFSSPTSCRNCPQHCQLSTAHWSLKGSSWNILKQLKHCFWQVAEHLI